MTIPKIMGILNVTPNSFSDGGQFDSAASACSLAEAIVVSGADIIDVGGESTHLFAKTVALQEELNLVFIHAIRTCTAG